jgi:ABC-type phosphate transport system substrate-binding protein
MNLIKSAVFFLLMATLHSPLESAPQAGAPVKASDIAVVVNAKNTTDRLTAEELRRILLGDRQFWKGTAQVKLILREHGTRESDVVLKVLLHMTNEDFNKHWSEKIYRGEVTDRPTRVPSSGLALEYVAGAPGAITFITATGSLRSDLKVVRIDGKLPGEQGYLLK